MFMNSGADLAPEFRPRTPALNLHQEKTNDLTRPVNPRDLEGHLELPEMSAELLLIICSGEVWAYFRNKECLQKLDCKCAARGNGPRASRAETEDGRVLKSPQKFH